MAVEILLDAGAKCAPTDERGLARPIYIYHKDTTSKQYESALNDSVVERVDEEMIVYSDRCVRTNAPAYEPSVAVALKHRPRARV